MKIRNRHSDKIKDVSFISWFDKTPNKEDFIVIDWGDLVYGQLIDKKGIKSDHQIIARDHAKRIINSDDRKYAIREITESEWAELRSQFHDFPTSNSTKGEEIELKKIEKELLRYISKSDDKVKSTKTFADAKGFSVSTINDVAKSLKEKYLITTEIEAGLDPKTQRSYISFRCESTPLGDDLLERVNKSNQEEPATYSSLSRFQRIKLKTNKILMIFEQHPVIRAIMIIGSIASILGLIYYLLDKYY